MRPETMVEAMKKGRVERLPLGIFDRHADKGQERWEWRLRIPLTERELGSGPAYSRYFK